MTIKECIDSVDAVKPNQYTIEDKVSWLSFIDQIIINDVLKTHEGYDGSYDDFTGYSAEDDLEVVLIVPSPYDRLYTAYLKMKIDQENGETARYNNSAALFNTYMMEYRKYYNKTHMPLSTAEMSLKPTPPDNNIGLTDAEYEKLKRDLYFELNESVLQATSDDKIYDIVMKYVNNNIELLKGKPGADGTVSFDNLTDAQKESLKGEQGPQGPIGPQGLEGKQGENGPAGLEVAQKDELIWTNPNPNAEFVRQTIIVPDMPEYTSLKLVFLQSLGGGILPISETKKNTSLNTVFSHTNEGEATARSFTISSETAIEFQDAVLLNDGGPANVTAIPYKIYGVKEETISVDSFVSPQNASNALKGTVSGEIVSMPDVSPIEHNIGVKVSGVEDLTAATLKKCGKNLFKPTVQSKTHKGVTFDLLEDGTYHVYGTNDGTGNSFCDNNITLPKGQYTGSGCPSGGTGKYRLEFYNRTTNKANVEYGEGVVFETAESTNFIVQMAVLPNQTVDLIFKPMIEVGIGGKVFEPYIEPIEYTPDADGTVDGVTSLYPVTTLLTDTAGAIIEAEYNRDINKAFASQQAEIDKLKAMILNITTN